MIYSRLSGEAAGLALGLVMLGSKSAQAIEDMVGYAQETQHEKILRGLAVGIAMVMYGRMEEADALIESLCRDKVRLRSIEFKVHTSQEHSCFVLINNKCCLNVKHTKQT